MICMKLDSQVHAGILLNGMHTLFFAALVSTPAPTSQHPAVFHNDYPRNIANTAVLKKVQLFSFYFFSLYLGGAVTY